MRQSNTKRLVEASLLVALGTVLSLFKLVEMPYGGSITLASMLPILILSYRHGVLTGLAGGAAYALLQQLLGLKYLSYFTTWQSVVALILLDYALAFTLVGLGGVWRKFVKKQSSALLFGAITVGALRYICHVIAGATVWAGLSIPDSAALIYSLGYNATYMVPETIVLAAVAYYVGEHIDLGAAEPKRIVPSADKAPSRALLPMAILTLGVIADVAMIAPSLQDEESGMLTLSGIAAAPWISVAIVSAVCVSAAVILYISSKRER